ncbi:MAG: lysylphosphatidylglycerol synthase transmembrane domain-containing protein [Hyphomicrobiales bacterium]
MTPRLRSGFWRWLPGTLILAVLFWLALRGVEWRRFSDLVRSAEPAWILAALVLQIGTYLCAAGVLHRGIAASDVRRPILSLVSMGVAKLFIDQVVPTGGLGGTLLVVRALERRAVPRGVATAAVVVNMLAFYAAYALAVLAALGFLWLGHRFHPWILVLVTLFAVYATAMPILILWIVYGGPRRRPAWLHKVKGLDAALRAIEEAPASTLRHPALFVESIALQLAIVVLDAVTLDVLLRAVGHPTPFGVVYTSFVLASIAATLSLLPGGVGSFEAGLVASLHYFAVPLEVALTSTLLIRGFTLWLPLVPGVWFARREMMGAPAPPDPT